MWRLKFTSAFLMTCLLTLALGSSAWAQKEPTTTAENIKIILDRAIAQMDPADEELNFTEFMDALTQELGEDHPSVLSLRNKLAIELYQQGKYAKARQLLEAILAKLRKTQSDRYSLTLGVTNNLAQVLKRQGEFNRARDMEEELLETRRNALGAEHPDTLTAMVNLASTLKAQGEFNRAQKILEEVLEIRQNILGTEHPDTLAARANLGSLLKAQGHFSRAHKILEEVLEDRRNLLGAEHPSTLAAKAILASTIRAQGNFLRAREMEEQLLETRRNVLGAEHPDTLTAGANLASTLKAQGEFNRARKILEKVLEIRRDTQGAEHPSTLAAKANLASTMRAQGEFSRAREMEEEILEIRRATLGAEHPSTLAARANLASTLKAQGEFSRAREILEEVLEARRNVLGAEHPSTLAAKANLASTLKAQGEFSRARGMEEQVLEARRNVLGRGHPDTLTTMANLASTLKAQGNFNRAREILEEVLEIRRNVLGIEHPDTLIARANLASTLKAQGKLSRAREILEEVLETLRSVLGAEHPSTLTAQYNLALCLYGQEDLNGARHLLEEIVAIRRSTFATDYTPGTLAEIHSIHSLGAIYAELNRPSTASQYLLQALDAVEALTGRSGDAEDSKSDFKAQFENIYRDTFTTLLALDRLADAHLVLERFRAQGFLTMLAERDVVLSGIPTELANKQRDLAAQYDAAIRARDKLYAKKHEAQLTAVLERQRKIRRERERLAAEIRRRVPNAAAIQYPTPLTIDEILEILEPGTLMLSYFTGPKETFLFTLSHNSDLRLHRLEVDEDTLWKQNLRYFEQLQSNISKQLAASRLQMSEWLYQKLIEPAVDEIERNQRLLIIADGPLHHLPFSALIRPTDTSNRRGWQYLIEWKPIHSALSATVYAQLQEWRPDPTSDPVQFQVAAFGNPTYPGDGSKGRGNAVVRSAIERGIFNGLDPLPYTEHEVTEIKKLFPEGFIQIFLGPNATEANAKTLGHLFRIVHFATHSVTDPFTQLDSFIAFSILDGQEENGLLQAWEIYERVRLDADLVVLSACQTAFGPETDGEGLMSLSRAFQYAGARTVMASLWSVNDASTAELMIRFYRHLRAGKTKDEALRAAQMDFIQESIEIGKNGRVVEKDYSSPFHWAAFQIIGDWR